VADYSNKEDLSNQLHHEKRSKVILKLLGASTATLPAFDKFASSFCSSSKK